MSNDQYQQRQFFEESGQFPDFREVFTDDSKLTTSKSYVIDQGTTISIPNTPEQQEKINELIKSI